MYQKVARLPRKIKILIMLFCDVILLPFALYSAIALRFSTFTPEVSSFYWVFFVLPIITVPIFIRVGLYRAIIRFMDDKVISIVFLGVSLSVLILIAIVLLAHVEGIPRSSLIIYWMLAVSYIAFSRFLARGILRGLERSSDGRQAVAIYGAGRAGLQTALALLSGPEFRPVAFFDDNKELHGTSVVGIRVYDPADALQVLAGKGCSQLLLAIPSASRSRRKEIIQQFEGNKDLVLKTLPGIGQLVDGRVSVQDIREVGVEDLLGRDPVPPYPDLIEGCIRDCVVMVTGAGGSIGSELCRQIIQNLPKKLILFEQSEYALYKIEQELKRHQTNIGIVPMLGDVRDQEILLNTISNHKVQTVYHAAAYKHVPLVESNVTAGVQNNVFGTMNVAQASLASGVEHFVLISTDKAVRPTNVMGASKRLAELVLQAMAKEYQTSKIKFTMVRFGNVLGSSGSVVPLFKEQIKIGGPVTVTHPDVTRFFMTIPEAAQLVLQAGSMGEGGDVFVLDMGESVKIAELAKKMIELSGFKVKDSLGVGDIGIEFVGLRPGEKLYEELLIGENVERTRHPRIMRAVEGMIEMQELYPQLTVLQEACRKNDSDAVIALLRILVREYKPQL